MKYDELDTVDKRVSGKKSSYSLHSQLAKRKKQQKARRKYVEYMSSDTWFKRRRLYLKTHAKVCVACGSTEEVTIHHKTYRNIGSEKDEDLVCLCKICHTTYHRTNLSTSKRSTDEFIKKIHEKRKKEGELLL
jgi:5-methylcytosine-specific restriction endonuclease McrA